ncbi:hypothetical protein CKAN_00359400 [Cinnamomum micranthum f. kanehirae]|uniref:Uncharacterized protein n=1 Tax=Cinnamomum micranthum f. kanehirae TaxID=337451 RepID=A0A3S3NU04_9MAGN|nr:hypothetical protein CKAN_00359400 [Cinnamomum micranthum f. kanehirae]
MPIRTMQLVSTSAGMLTSRSECRFGVSKFKELLICEGIACLQHCREAWSIFMTESDGLSLEPFLEKSAELGI